MLTPVLPATAQPAAAPSADALGAAYGDIDRLFADFAAREHVPGIAYGIVVGGRVAHVGVAGSRTMADDGTTGSARVDASTVFRIASMTKSFTAAAVLQLRDAGRLSLDDPAARYVPELAALAPATSDAPPITIRHLLTHSAGFPEDNPWGDQQLAITDDEMAALMTAGIPFSTAPGTAYEYSNYGFAILGRIVARVSGMRFADYLGQHVLRPLGMTATTLEAADVPDARLATGYRWQDDRWLAEPALADGAFGPMGGLLTTVDDLSRWVAFLSDAFPARDGADSPVLSRASRREMQQMARYNTTTAVRNAETGAVAMTASGYGYGLRITQTCAFRHVVAHSGGLPGYGSQMRWLPESGVGIVAMGNRTYTGWNAPFDAALARLAETGLLAPRPVAPAPILLQRQAEVTRLVQTWDDALATRLAADNLALDESFARRRAAIARAVGDAGGQCVPLGEIVPENALRGAWRMRCATGDLKVDHHPRPRPRGARPAPRRDAHRARHAHRAAADVSVREWGDG